MTVHVPRLPISVDPLIAEAKRRMRKRRVLAAVLIIALAVGAPLALRTPGATPAGRNSAGDTSRLALRVHGQGVLSVGTVRLRCISQAASEIVCKGTASVRRRSVTTLRERPRPGWQFVNWSGACRGVSATCRLPNSRIATVAATFHRS